MSQGFRIRSGRLLRRFDPTRPVHWPGLALDFTICVGVWVIGVIVQGATVSTPGLVASFGTATALTVVSWTLAKLDIPSRPAPASDLADS